MDQKQAIESIREFALEYALNADDNVQPSEILSGSGNAWFYDPVNKTMELISEIDNQGGAVSAIENSFQQEQIANSSYEYQREIESGEQVVVGVNKFTDHENQKSDNIFSIDQNAIKDQLDRLKMFKKNRHIENVNESLKKLKKSLNLNKNLIPSIIYCIKNHCTLGEICDVLKSKYGTYI